jgi:hypothetical protein
MFGLGNAACEQFVIAFSQLEKLRYTQTFEGDFNVYTGTGNHNPVSKESLMIYQSIPGMIIESNEYGFIIPEITALVPVEFPDSSINTGTEEAPVMVQKTWEEYTIWKECDGGYFVHIGIKKNGNFYDLPGNEIHRIYWDHFGLSNIVIAKDIASSGEV